MNKTIRLAVSLLLPLAAINATAAANFPVGTHLYKGTLKDWQNKVLTSTAAVTIQAVATNGSVIASTKVSNPSEDGYNFLLQIPLSTTATDSTAAVGDPSAMSGNSRRSMTTRPGFSLQTRRQASSSSRASLRRARLDRRAYPSTARRLMAASTTS